MSDEDVFEDGSETQDIIPRATYEPRRERERRIAPQRGELVLHEGPLPAPQDLREYDAIVPNGAERIMCMAELEAEHRRYSAKYDFRTQRLALIFAFTLALVTIIGGFWMLSLGKPLAGFAAILIPAAALVTATAYNRKLESSKEKVRVSNSEDNSRSALPNNGRLS